MSEFKIDKGIPLPPRGANGPRSRYPLADLEVGDSFFAPVVNGQEPRELLRRLSGLPATHKPKRFAMRTVEGGVRVWRIE